MNYNILSYIVYSCITVYVIYYVGKLFHRNGRIFILQLFHHNEALSDTTNNILLTGYYLFNIGYSIIQLSRWQPVPDISSVISSVSVKSGTLILILAVMHFFNMLIIYYLSDKNNHLITSKKIKS